MAKTFTNAYKEVFECLSRSASTTETGDLHRYGTELIRYKQTLRDLRVIAGNKERQNIQLLVKFGKEFMKGLVDANLPDGDEW